MTGYVTFAGKKRGIPHLPLSLLLLLLVVIPSVSAFSISFADKTLSGSSDFLVYDSTGTLINSTWNTTTSGISLDPNESYYFIMEPAKSQLLDDPYSLLDTVVQYAQNNAFPIVLLIIFAAVLLGRR
jgi:hypothetical protein